MDPYFFVQGKIGLTKHPNGLYDTEKLVKLCKLKKNSYVLEVGCGAGATSHYLATKIGCRVVGIDISQDMVDRARERCAMLNNAEFHVANAEKLPFRDRLFDAVISESVTAFVNKGKAIREYKRVLKKGGYVGLNETTWLKDPEKKHVQYIKRSAGGCVSLDQHGWEHLVKHAGLELVHSESSRLATFRGLMGEIKMAGMGAFFKAWGRMFSLLFTSKAFRKQLKKLTKNAIRIPLGLTRVWGKGIYVGKKE